VSAELGVEGELPASVHRRHEGASFAIEGDVHPGRRVRHRGVEGRRAQVDRDHPAAHEIALDRGLAAVTDAELLATVLRGPSAPTR
jgi:hypothetical protein